MAEFSRVAPPTSWAALLLPVLMLSLTEITARSVWQYGWGGLAAPAGALLALVLASTGVLPHMDRAHAHSLAHWLSQRSYMILRRPLALLVLGVDITVLSLLVQATTGLVAAPSGGDATWSLAAVLLVLALVFALPQPGAARYRSMIGLLLIAGAIGLSSAGVWLGIDSSIDWATLRARTPEMFDSLWMLLSFMLASLTIPALYRRGTNGARGAWALLAAGVALTALCAYMAMAGIAGADPVYLRSAPALLQGLQGQTLARPLYAAVLAATVVGLGAAACVMLESIAQTLLDDLLRMPHRPQAEYLPRALVATGAILLAQLIATGDSGIARVAIGLSSFGAATMAVPILYATRRAATPLVLVLAGLIAAVVWVAAVVQQSPGDPALWAAGAAAIYVSLDGLSRRLRPARLSKIQGLP